MNRTCLDPSKDSGIDTSVVITTCSRAGSLAALLDGLLPALEAAPFSVEVVVVDDGSTDNTAEVLERVAAAARLPVRVVSGACTGVAAARNLGLSVARGAWIATCDDDQIALPGWLLRLREAADRFHADAVGGPLTLHLPAPFVPEQFGPRAQRLLGWSDPAGDVRPYALGHAPATNNALMRAATVRAMGGFDERFTEGGEDADLFQRMTQAGCRIVYQPAARMVHMLTERRLTTAGMRWAAMRVGAGQARVFRHTGGVARLARHLVARLAMLLLRDAPMLLLQTARHRTTAALDTRCSLWYTAGLFGAAPAVLRGSRQSPFLRRMDFRSRNGERERTNPGS